MLRWWALCFAFLIGGCATGVARTIILRWNPSPGPDIAGYKILCGSEAYRYTHIRDVGNVSQAQYELPEGLPEYHLAVLAYNVYGLESLPSQEVVYRPPALPRLQLALGKPHQLKITWNAVPGTGYRVLYKPSLTVSNWVPISKVLVAGASAMEWMTQVDPGAPSGFFAVQVLKDPNKLPVLQMALTNRFLRLSWGAVPGRAYRVLYKPELAARSWIPVSGLITADATTLEWMTAVDPNSPSGFFRLQVIDDPDALPVTTIAGSGRNQIKLTWTSVPTKTYRVFFRTDLSSGTWQPVSGILTADALAMEWSTPIDPSVPSGFFMVQPVTAP